MSLKKHKSPIAAAAGLAMLLTTVGFGALPANASTTCTVNSGADSGTGTLRECLADFNSTTTTGQIDIGFDPGVTEITLTSSLEINHVEGSNSSTDIVVIDGAGAVTIKSDGSDFALLDIKDAYFVTLKGLTFSGARHTGNGGGVLVSDAGDLKGGTLLIEDTTFDDNQAANGAGVYWAGSAGTLKFEEGDLETGTLFTNNLATNEGGAVWTSTNLGFFDSKAVSNSADKGGALYIGGGSSTSSVIGNSFEDNSATAGDGGAVYVSGVDLEILRSHFENNSATGDGGGLYGADTGSDKIKINFSSFVGNSAGDYGGAIESNGVLTVADSTFDSNEAVAWGAAIGAANEALIVFSTFVDNFLDPATNLGVVYADGATASVYGSLFVADQNFTGQPQLSEGNSGTIVDLGSNISTSSNEILISVANGSVDGVSANSLAVQALAQDPNGITKSRAFGTLTDITDVTPIAGRPFISLSTEMEFNDPYTGAKYRANITDQAGAERALDHAPGALYYPYSSGGSTSSDSDSSFSAPAPYQGPVVSGIGGSSGTTSAAPGEVISLDGSNLESVSAVTVGGLDAEVESTETGVGFVIPTGLDIGNYDLTVTSDSGTVTISGAINITVASTEGYGALKAWTKRISETEAKVYVKFPQVGNRIEITHQTGGSGEYSPVVTRTVTSTTDDFLTVNEVGTYLVRTIDLEDINRIRVIVDGEKLVQVIYK